MVGGGHSHVIVLKILAMKPVPGLRVTLISPDVRTAYSGMLPGVVAGHYTSDDIHIELGPLCRFAGARFIKSEVHGLDPRAQKIQCEGRPDVDYDVVSIDIGITPAVSDVEGAEGNVIAVKPINEFLAKFERFLVRVDDNQVKRVGIVGGGVGGVELCLAIRHRLQTMPRGRDVAIELLTDSDCILPELPVAVRDLFDAKLADRNIPVRYDFRVISVDAGTLLSATGQQQSFDEIFLVTRAASQPWLQQTGLSLSEAGFILVRPTLQSVNFDNVFATGDIAEVPAYPRPKAGVFAVRQGPPLFRNIQRFLAGKKPRPFKPQSEFLKLGTTGNKYVIASRGGFTAKGRTLWWLKDRIDRRFMNRFNRLPEMQETQMQCGGCGAKISADLLREVLAEQGVDIALGDDAAVVDVPPGKVLLQSVDGFRAFIEDPFVFAKIAVNHALGDLYAMGAMPVSALAAVTLPYATPARTRSILNDVLAGTMQMLREEGVELIGGHTSEGPELALGFTVNGLADEHSLLRKRGAASGDALVLTKPLGTGALFAADMQSKARGAWIEGAIESMLQSNRSALEVLRRHSVHALTDVTGFGLAGHLGEMLADSGLKAQLDLGALPVLEGVFEVMDQGIRSTLHEGNMRSATLATGIASMSGNPFALLFDPQTCGGLLAAVPAAQAGAVVSALVAAGYASACVIGRVGDRGDRDGASIVLK